MVKRYLAYALPLGHTKAGIAREILDKIEGPVHYLHILVLLYTYSRIPHTNIAGDTAAPLLSHSYTSHELS